MPIPVAIGLMLMFVGAALLVVHSISERQQQSRYLQFTKTHVGAIYDQLTIGRMRMDTDSAKALLTPDR